MLGRGITTVELIQLNRMFAANRGYKDLIRDMKHDFNVDLPKGLAKQFLINRSWQEVLYWLTGDRIDTKDLDKIPEIKHEHYELLEQMIKLNKIDQEERMKDISAFIAGKYYVPERCKYFNLPLYGEIITYKYKDPMMKCFMFDSTSHRINKIEDVPVSDNLPYFLLSIIRKINTSPICTKLEYKDMIQQPNYQHMITLEQSQAEDRCDIFESELFRKYNIVCRE